MNKEKVLKDIIVNLRLLADNIECLFEDNEYEVEEKPKAKNLKKAEPTESAEEEPKQITLEEVRSVLAVKSKDGFTEKIKGIINSLGADKLSDVDPSNYEDLLKEAEKLE